MMQVNLNYGHTNLNSEESRKVVSIKQELKLEAQHDLAKLPLSKYIKTVPAEPMK